MYNSDGDVIRSWNCTDSDCTCEGAACSAYTLTVSTEGTAPKLSPFFDCSIYGNMVKYVRNDGKQMGAYEIAIIRKPGRITSKCHNHSSYLHISFLVSDLFHTISFR